MVTVYIDGKAHEVKEGQNLLQAALTLGYNLPYFCWHPVLGSVGACRQCAVKQFRDEKDEQGLIVMACMTPVAEGLRCSINDPEAVAFRATVIEWLMTNHPHDCPVCDEGGECHLQDMTVMSGHTYRKHRFNKRTFRNQNLGPFVNHEMNRCIQCYRCVRFYQEYAGGKDLNAFASRNRTYFGRARPGVLESPFSGNLVEICPTGVFTDKTLREHYTRKWDLQTAPSVCIHCGLGCNTLPGERYGDLRRIRNRYHHAVNGYFLCDRGRYGYAFVNSEQRVREPRFRARAEDPTPPLTPEEAVGKAAKIIGESQRVVGIGSPRSSLEANYLLRTLVGAEHFFNGMTAAQSECVAEVIRILREGRVPSATLGETAKADAVLVLGEDVTHTAPLLDLNLRQAVRQQPMKKAEALQIPLWSDACVRLVTGEEKGPLFMATPAPACLDEIAAGTYRAAPEDIARLGFAVAHALDESAPAVDGLSPVVEILARTVADALAAARRPLVVSGVSLGSPAVLRAAAAVSAALAALEKDASLFFTLPECNTMGLGLMEAPDLDAAMHAVASGGADTVIVLENDLTRRIPGDLLDPFLEKTGHMMVLDQLEHGTTERAELVLPAATFAEGNGTFVNCEGRAQRFYQVFAQEDAVHPSWLWLHKMLENTGAEVPWQQIEDVAYALAGELTVFGPILNLEPRSDYRRPGGKVPRQSHRYSGRTAMDAHISVNEPKPPDDPESPFSFSMEGSLRQPPPALVNRYYAAGWSSVSALNKFQEEVGGPLRGDDPGGRLLEPSGDAGNLEPGEVPEAFSPRQGFLRLVPVHHLFGSDELSMETAGVAELAPEPYLSLSPEDGEILRISEGEELDVHLEGRILTLPVKLVPGLPRGVAGLPVVGELSPFSGRAWWARLEKRS